MRRTIPGILLAAVCTLIAGCIEPMTEYKASDSHLSSLVGKREPELIRSTGQPGFLVYGPYTSLPAGSYRLVARGSLKGSATGAMPIATMDVIAQKGERVLVSRPLYGDENPGEDMIAALTFDLPRAVSDAEFRIQVTEKATVAFRAYQLTKVNNLP